MADVVEELTTLGKALVDSEHKSSDDVRKSLENARRFLVVVGEVLDIYDYTLTLDLTHAANGNRKRARTVTRPLRHGSLLVLSANRRIRVVWNNFQKIFAEELASTRRRDRRDPFEFGG